MFEDSDETAYVDGKIVLSEYFFASFDGNLSPQVVVGQERRHGLGQCVYGRRRYEDALQSRPDQFRDAGHISADAGDLHGHRFHKSDRDTFGEAGQHKEIGGPEKLPGGRVTECSMKRDDILQIVAIDEVPQALSARAIAHDTETGGDPAAIQLKQGFQKDYLAFRRMKSSDIHDVQGLSVFVFTLGTGYKHVRLDTKTADVKLGPIGDRRDLEQLAAAVVTDAGHKGRQPNLLFEK